MTSLAHGAIRFMVCLGQGGWRGVQAEASFECSWIIGTGGGGRGGGENEVRDGGVFSC